MSITSEVKNWWCLDGGLRQSKLGWVSASQSESEFKVSVRIIRRIFQLFPKIQTFEFPQFDANTISMTNTVLLFEHNT